MIGVICNDAGGGQLINSYLNQTNEKFIISISGPSLQIFRKKIQKYNNYKINQVLENCDWILTGTSYPSKRELIAITKSKKLNIKSITILDHWVNYEKRFIFKNKLIKPNEIWVTDKYSAEIAKKKFKNSLIKIKKNYYFFELKKEYQKIKFKKKDCNNILFFGSIYNSSYKNFNNLYCLEFILKNLKKFNLKFNKFIIRPHPREELKKYSKLVNMYDYEFELSKHTSIIEDIKSSKYIFGTNTMALVIASLFKKNVYNVLPKSLKIKSSLPQKRIQDIYSLFKNE